MLSTQARLGIVFFMVLIVGITSLSVWNNQIEFVPLFEEKLKVEDANKITAKLTELGAEYRIGANSSEIFVSPTDKPNILLKLASGGQN